MFWIVPEEQATELLKISPDAVWFANDIGYVTDPKRLEDLANSGLTPAQIAQIQQVAQDNGRTIDTNISSYTPPSEFLAGGKLSGNANALFVDLTLVPERVDFNWELTKDTATFKRSADHIIIRANVYMVLPNGSTFQRISPELFLMKNDEAVAWSATAYQRHATGHNSTSNDINYVDLNPGKDPVYTLRTSQGSWQSDVVPITISSFSLTAKV